MNKAFWKLKSVPVIVGALLTGMAFIISACQDNAPSVPPSPIAGRGPGGIVVSSPSSSASNYVAAGVGYELTSLGSSVITTYALIADVAVNGSPVSNAAVTFVDPNGTTQYPLSFSGNDVVVSGVTCGSYRDSLSSFTTVGTFKMELETTSGFSGASVTALNSIVTYSSPYTVVSWTGSPQQNTMSVQSVATPSASYSQSSATSPMSIPSSTYSSGVTYDYLFAQLNASTTITGGNGFFEYFQLSNGTFVAP